MAVDRTEASLYGVGRGDAFVWGDNRALQGLKEFQKQDQLRRMKEDAEIQESMSKINLDGARNEDLPEILNRYQGIKQTFVKLRGTNNPQERIKLQTQYNEQKMEVSRAVEASKKFGAGLAELGKLRLTHRDDLVDDFDSKYVPITKMSAFDPKAADLVNELSSSALAPKFDHMGYSKHLLERSTKQIQGKDEVVRNGSLTRVQRQEGEALDADNLLKNSIEAYTKDRKFKRYIDTVYKGQDPEDAIKTYASELYTSNKDAFNKVKTSNVASKWDPVAAPMSEWQKWQIRNGYDPRKAGRTEGDDDRIYRQEWVDGMWNREPGSGEKLVSAVAALPEYEGQIKIRESKDKRYLKFDIPAKKMTTFDEDKGEAVTKVKAEGRTVTIDRDNPADRDKLNALVSNLTGENINPTKFNTVGGKGKKTRTPASGSAPQKSASKEVPLSKVKSLVGKPGYEGYSEKELVEYYKSQGYKIK